MKTKKVLSLILALCMILCMLPTVTFAEGEVTDATQATAGYVARIGDEGTGTYYKTLNEAVLAVTQSNLTVTMIADATVSSTIKLTSAQDGIVIDAAGKTITQMASPMIRNDAYDATIKNANIAVAKNRLFQTSCSTADVTCTLDTCTVTAGSNYLFNVKDEATFEGTHGKVDWVVKNSTVTLNGSETWMYCHTNYDVTLTLDNTTVNKTVTSKNDAVFNAQNLNSFTLNLKNGSSVTVASTKANATLYAIHMSGGVKSVLNFDAGTKLIFDTCGTNVVSAQLFYGDNVTVNDSGVEYIVNPASKATTLTLPAIDGKVYKCGDKNYTNGIDLSKFDRTSALSFKAVTGVISVSNDTEAISEGYVCRIGANETGTYYGTLSAAFSALKDNDTITLLKDVTTTCISVKNGGKIFTLDGNNHKLTMSGDAFVLHDCESTFKNLTLENKGVTFTVRVEKGDSLTLNIENCNITSSAMVFKCQTYVASTWQYVNIKDSTVISGADDWMLGNDTGVGGQYMRFTFDNSTARKTKSADNGANYSMFIISGNKEKKLEVYVKNGSRLIAENANTSSKVTKNYLFSYGDSKNSPSGTFDLYLDKTAVLELAPKATNIVDNRFVWFNSNVTATLHDEGATWKISKEAIAQGAYYPGFSNTELIGWSFNNNLYAPVATTGIGVIDKKLTVGDDGLTISPVFLDADDFYMVDGASIRLEGPTGIRFKTRVSNDLLNLLGENVTFGTYFTPTSKLASFENDFKTLIGGGSEGSDYVKVDRTKWALTNDNGENEFRSVLYGLTEDKTGYTLAISAISFMEITYADSTYNTFYTAYSDANNSRTMNAVAASAISAGETTTYLQSIVDACK